MHHSLLPAFHNARTMSHGVKTFSFPLFSMSGAGMGGGAGGGGGGGGPGGMSPAGPLGALLGVTGILYAGYNSFYTVEGGHRALLFNRLIGVKEEVYMEGMHFMIPWFDMPIIYDIRPKPRMIQSLTGSKGTYRLLLHGIPCACMHPSILEGPRSPILLGWRRPSHPAHFFPPSPRHANGQHHHPRFV